MWCAAIRDEVAERVSNSSVGRRVPLAKYIRAEVQSRLKPVEGKVCSTPSGDTIVCVFGVLNL